MNGAVYTATAHQRGVSGIYNCVALDSRDVLNTQADLFRNRHAPKVCAYYGRIPLRSSAGAVKDHYRTLGIHPKATAEEVKTAYRALARKHHPDADRDNPYAAARFREIGEAYATLSQPAHRRRYDEERWLSGFSARDRRGPVTPDTLLRDAHKLAAHLRAIDRAHMNHAALRNLLLFLLSDEHLSILRTSGDTERQTLLAEALLESAAVLRPLYFEDVAVRLVLVTPGNEVMLRRINAIGAERRRQVWWERWTPLIVVVIVVALCVAMMLTVPR